MVRRKWHKLLTLACLLAFVFVAAAHAGHHLSIPSNSVVVTALDVSGDDGDSGDAVNDNVCVFCALAAAELPAMPVITADSLRVLVETSEPALAPRHLAAESPPPIA